MRKVNRYMIPTGKRSSQKKYVCASCNKHISAESAFFYVDSCNCAITNNSRPYCQECYEKKYHR